LIKVLVITPCYGHVWALTEILKAAGYDTYGIIIGHEELEAEDIEDNLLSIQQLDEVVDQIYSINPDVIIITRTLNQVLTGDDIRNKAPEYLYLTFSFGGLIHFPCKETSIITTADFSEAGRKIWLEKLKQFLGD
jgi:hypothetical protein